MGADGVAMARARARGPSEVMDEPAVTGGVRPDGEPGPERNGARTWRDRSSGEVWVGAVPADSVKAALMPAMQRERLPVTRGQIPAMSGWNGNGSTTRCGGPPMER